MITCVNPNHDHRTTQGADGSELDTPVEMLCGHCKKPAHYNNVDGQYYHDGTDVPECFLIEKCDDEPCTEDVEVPITNTVVLDAATTNAINAALQATVVGLRKELGLSRRQLSVEMGWTESRVWYLEQVGLRLDVARNVADLRRELDKLEELKTAGWSKPTVKTAKTAGSAQDVQKLVDEAVAQARAEYVDAVKKARAAHAEDLAVLLTTAENLLLDAKAKKNKTAGFASLVEKISSMQWSAE